MSQTSTSRDPKTEVTQEKRTALSKLLKLRPFTAAPETQFFASPVKEDSLLSLRSYYRFRASWEQAQIFGRENRTNILHSVDAQRTRR